MLRFTNGCCGNVRDKAFNDILHRKEWTMRRYLFNPWTWILLIAALLPRLFDLDQFLTSDENTNIFLAGSAVVQAFLQGNFRETYWHFYPGVTMSWAGGIGLAGQWLVAKLGNATSQPLINYLDNDILSLLVAARLPYVILTALFVPVVYHLLSHWLDPAKSDHNPNHLALAAAFLIAFDPFFLAHSRVAHGDAPVSVFLLLSILAFCLYLRDNGLKMLIFSAVMGSLAALTKAPGQLIAPFVIVLAVIDWLWGSKKSGRFDWEGGKRRLLGVSLWGGIAFIVMVALWPSMWVDPIGTLRQMLDETFGKVNQGHLVFFQGRPTLNPGPWFYPYVIPFRLTPLTSLGALFSLGMLGYFVFTSARESGRESGEQGSKGAGGQGGRGEMTASNGGWPGGLQVMIDRRLYILTALLWFFVLFFLLAGNLSPKKQDRYLLPLFPALDILAAIGWFGIWQLVMTRLVKGQRLIWGWLAGLIMVQAAFSLPHHPYYLAYFNPLMGGLPRAVETTLVGWGEGMEQVAAYLNQKPKAETLYVASTPAQTLLPYFKGQGENFYTNDVAMRADYVIIYRAQQQRLAPSPEIVNYYLAQEPEHVVEIEGVPYAWIYPNTPLVFSAVPDWATMTNIGFGDPAIMRLAGYAIEPAQATLEVDLFWHALPAIENDLGPCQAARVEHIETAVCPRIDYTISLRLLGSDGALIAQHDGWPANGLLPTSQWRVDDYIQDHYALTLPADWSGGEYRLAVVVYNGETHDVLAGPVEFVKAEF